MADMMERAARALCEEDCSSADGQCWVSTPTGERIGFEWELYSHEARAALLAALDPEDESLVSAIAQRLADDATVARNELRLIRQGIDLSSAEPVSPSIFKKDARVMIATLKAMAQGETKP